jgi:hypothetical protein
MECSKDDWNVGQQGDHAVLYTYGWLCLPEWKAFAPTDDVLGNEWRWKSMQHYLFY